MPPKSSQSSYDTVNVELTAPSAYSVSSHDNNTDHTIDVQEGKLGRKKTNVIVKVGRGIEQGAKKTSTAVVSVWDDFSNFIKRGNVVRLHTLLGPLPPFPYPSSLPFRNEI